jgi:hypothetical protein
MSPVAAQSWRPTPGLSFGFSVSLTQGHAVHVTLPGQPSGVPGPAAWTIMILGFGGTGAVLRRRRLVVWPA